MSDSPKRILGRRCSSYSFDRLLTKSVRAARQKGKPDVAALGYAATCARASWDAHQARLAAAKKPGASAMKPPDAQIQATERT